MIWCVRFFVAVSLLLSACGKDGGSRLERIPNPAPTPNPVATPVAPTPAVSTPVTSTPAVPTPAASTPAPSATSVSTLPAPAKTNFTTSILIDLPKEMPETQAAEIKTRIFALLQLPQLNGKAFTVIRVDDYEHGTENDFSRSNPLRVVQIKKDWNDKQIIDYLTSQPTKVEFETQIDELNKTVKLLKTKFRRELTFDHYRLKEPLKRLERARRLLRLMEDPAIADRAFKKLEVDSYFRPMTYTQYLEYPAEVTEEELRSFLLTAPTQAEFAQIMDRDEDMLNCVLQNAGVHVIFDTAWTMTVHGRIKISEKLCALAQSGTFKDKAVRSIEIETDPTAPTINMRREFKLNEKDFDNFEKIILALPTYKEWKIQRAELYAQVAAFQDKFEVEMDYSYLEYLYPNQVKDPINSVTRAFEDAEIRGKGITRLRFDYFESELNAEGVVAVRPSRTEAEIIELLRKQKPVEKPKAE